MNISRMTLPYPILGVNDDILPRPALPNIDVQDVKDRYIFRFDIRLNNPTIENLVEEGYAMYVCEVESPKTLYRKGFIQSDNKFSIEIPKHDLTGTISFEVTVTAVRQIQCYQNPGFHEDYQGYTFNLDAGDLLAYITQFTYDADIRYDQLQAVGSFMEITAGAEGSITNVELDHDKIRIVLPKDMFDNYHQSFVNNNKVASVIHASLVFNALIEALYNARDHRTTLWCRTIEYRLQTEENLKRFYVEDDLFGDDDVFNIAQELLGDPYSRMFNCLNELSNSDADIDIE